MTTLTKITVTRAAVSHFHPENWFVCVCVSKCTAMSVSVCVHWCVLLQSFSSTAALCLPLYGNFPSLIGRSSVLLLKAVGSLCLRVKVSSRKTNFKVIFFSFQEGNKRRTNFPFEFHTHVQYIHSTKCGGVYCVSRHLLLNVYQYVSGKEACFTVLEFSGYRYIRNSQNKSNKKSSETPS